MTSTALADPHRSLRESEIGKPMKSSLGSLLSSASRMRIQIFAIARRTAFDETGATATSRAFMSIAMSSLAGYGRLNVAPSG